jgi:hypothetical protein
MYNEKEQALILFCSGINTLSPVFSVHNRVVVLAGRQPGFVLRLVLRRKSSPREMLHLWKNSISAFCGKAEGDDDEEKRPGGETDQE